MTPINDRVILDFVKKTLIKGKRKLNDKSLFYLLSVGFKEIILRGNYNYFTSWDRTRSAVMLHSPLEYLDYIIDSVCKKTGQSRSEIERSVFVTDGLGDRCVSALGVDVLLHSYFDAILSKENVDVISREAFDDKGLLLRAVKATIISKGKPLTRDEYCKQLKLILKEIILNSSYHEITSGYGNVNYRMKLFYYSPLKLLNYVIDTVSDSVESRLNIERKISFTDGRGDRVLDSRMVEFYLDQFIEKLDIPSRYLSYDEEESNYKTNNNKIFDATKANLLREYVASGKQVRVKSSGFKFFGLQAYSDEGKVRTNQEDSYYMMAHPKNPDFKIMVVADGMGGFENGELASNLVVRRIMKWFDSIPPSEFYNEDNTELNKEVVRLLNHINSELLSLYPNSGSTLCMCIAKNTGLCMYNVGDSRGLVTENGKLIYKTKTDNVPGISGIPDEFNKFHPDSNRLVNGLGGTPDVSVHCDTIPMAAGRKYKVILCSDGVSDVLNDKEIIQHSLSDDGARDIVEAALENKADLYKELDSHKPKSVFDVITRGKYKKLVKSLLENGISLTQNKIIYGGTDNTTALVGDFSRGGRSR